MANQILRTTRARLSQAEAWIREPSPQAATRREGELKRGLQEASIAACWALWRALEQAGQEEDGAVRCVLQGGAVTLWLRTGATTAPIPQDQIPPWIRAWLAGEPPVEGVVLAATDRHGWALIRQAAGHHGRRSPTP